MIAIELRTSIAAEQFQRGNSWYATDEEVDCVWNT
jgi:hypothetical protein